MNSLTLNLINMFSTLFPISCLNDCLPEKSLWDQIHGAMPARIWTSECIRGFPYEPSILSSVYVSKKCSVIGADLRLFIRPTLCILCELTSEYLYSASVEWCPAAVAVYYVCSWSAFAGGVSTERSQVSMLQHHFSMWTIAWERVMSGEIGLKSMFLIQTKMLDRQNHIKWGWQVPQMPSPSPCWSFPTVLNYLHLKTYEKHCPALPRCPFWRLHIRGCASPWYLVVSPWPGLCPDLAKNSLPDDQLTE